VVVDLVAAHADEVMGLWAGYCCAARNLHRCAQDVRVPHGGVFPSTAEQLQPARYHVFDRRRDCLLLFYERVAILIGNVKRRPACVLACQ
jgi:A/G-specific adenine glycosylase